MPVATRDTDGVAHRPHTPIQALMEAPPGYDPEQSELELLAEGDELGAAIEDALAGLTGLTLAVTTLHLRGHSSREAAKALGIPKSTAWKYIRIGLNEMAAALEEHPAVQGHLTRGEP